jgi:hypothetical protein
MFSRTFVVHKDIHTDHPGELTDLFKPGTFHFNGVVVGMIVWVNSFAMRVKFNWKGVWSGLWRKNKAIHLKS